MRFLKAAITGLLSFAMIYFVPVTANIISGLLSSIPIKAGAKGIVPALIQLAIALLLWLLLFLLFGGKKKRN